MEARETILAQTALEFAHSASQRKRTVDRHLALQIAVEEVLESILSRRAGDFEINTFLNQRMLEPMLNLTSTPDAAGAPDVLDAIESLSRKHSEHARAAAYMTT